MGVKGSLRLGILSLGLLAGVMLSKALSTSASSGGLKTIHPNCAVSGCHQGSSNELYGTVVSISQKAKLIQMDTGQTLDLFFDEQTKVMNWNQPINKVSKGMPVRIVFSERDGKRTATLLSVKPPLPTLLKPEQKITLEEVKKIWEERSALLIDVRPVPKHLEGAIPGAINIPVPKLESELPKVVPDKNKPILFYCEGWHCVLTPTAVFKATAMGYTNVRGFIDGFPAWRKAGLPVVTSPKHLLVEMEKGMPFVLIDVRPAELAKKEHLPNAVNIPLDQLDKSKGLFPEKKNAPIFVYSDKDENALSGFKVIRGWGYTNVGYIPGGVEAWKKAGGKVEKDKLASKIVYVPKPRPGTFPVDEFLRILNSPTPPSQYLIVDVREPDEYQQGSFKYAKNIPLTELESRLKEIPKDKVILVHCVTGLRAEMAYNVLKRAGFNVLYLNANIEFDGNKFSIEAKD